MRKLVMVSMAVAGVVWWWTWVLNDNMEDCVLRNVKDVSTEQGAILVYRSCRSKYGRDLKTSSTTFISASMA